MSTNWILNKTFKKTKNKTGAVEYTCTGTNQLVFFLTSGNNRFHDQEEKVTFNISRAEKKPGSEVVGL